MSILTALFEITATSMINLNTSRTGYDEISNNTTQKEEEKAYTLDYYVRLICNHNLLMKKIDVKLQMSYLNSC